MNTRGKILPVFFLILFLLGGYKTVTGQNTQQEPNRLSIGIMGSVTTGHLDLGSAFQSGVDANFEFEERLNSTIGFNLRYVATPEIALQTNVVFGKFSIMSDIFPEDALSFDNNYVSTTFTTQLSLVRLFGAQARNFNLFGSFGTGLMFNDVSIHSDNPAITQSDVTAADHPFQTFFTTFGGGVRFNLGPNLDSFAQYEYSSASRDIIDGNFIGELLNLGGSAEIANSWSGVSFGLQFKFGGSNIDADWPTVARNIAPEPPPEPSMFERLEELLARQAEMFQTEINQLTERIDSLELALLEEKQRNDDLAREREAPPPNEEMAEMIRELQQKVAELESALAAEREESAEQPAIAEESDDSEQYPATEARPKPVAIHRVPLQGERIGLKELPKPLPIDIILVPDDPLGLDQAEELAETTESSEEKIEDTEPETIESEEIAEEVSPEDTEAEEALTETVVEETEVDVDTEETIDITDAAETLAEADVEETEITEEKPEDVIKRADSLRVIESIEELDSTDQGMSPVRADVTRPDTADLEAPKPEEKEPELPETVPSDSEQPQADDSESIASADIENEETPVPDEEVLAQEPTDPVSSDTTVTEDTPAEDQTAEATEDMNQETERGYNWTWFAIIAIVVLGVIYFISNMFKSKSGSDSDTNS